MMDEPRNDPDPSALTQPLPIAPPVAGPPGAPVAAPHRAPVAAPHGAPVGAPPRATVGAAYVHRFGSVPAYLVARLFAFLIDVAGVGFVLATFGYHATEIGFVFGAGRDATGYGTLVALSLAGASLFAFLCEALFGTTLGKLVFALHTRRRDGGHAGGGRVVVRYLLLPLDLLAIGPLLALVTPRHQRVGDVVGGTVVARSRLGALASLLGCIALAGIGYLQVAFGGGLTSAIGVAAETADFAPGLVARAARATGVGTSATPEAFPTSPASPTP